jgi:predicted TIM-barrel fold metal-dependent hydrolase
MDRRDFLLTTASTGITLAAGTTLRAKEPSQRTSGSQYIDCHVHLTQPWYGDVRRIVTVDHLLRWMDAHEIAQAAVLPLVSPESFWYPVTTDFVLRETRPHRSRLVPFCAIDPRTLATHLPEKANVVDVLSRYRDAGARGFGEHKPMLPIDDPMCMRLYEACSEVKMPLLFHLDNFANMDAPGLPGLDKVLAAFPELVFIGHGKGWWASIAGGLSQADLQVGYPRGPVAPGGAIERLMDAHPNLYGDLSSSGAHAILRDPKFGREFLLRRAERLLFGTDYYDPAIQTEFAQFALFRQFELPADAVEAISRKNAQRLFNLA